MYPACGYLWHVSKLIILRENSCCEHFEHEKAGAKKSDRQEDEKLMYKCLLDNS